VYEAEGLRMTGKVQDVGVKGREGSVSAGFGASEAAGWDCDFDGFVV
jgi:hypothetical protein